MQQSLTHSRKYCWDEWIYMEEINIWKINIRCNEFDRHIPKFVLPTEKWCFGTKMKI